MQIKRDPTKPIDVLLIAKWDWANSGFRYWRCLQSLGLQALMVKGEPHHLRYPHQAPIHPSLTGMVLANAPVTVQAPGLETLINSAHVVHFIGSCFVLNDAINWHEKNVVVQHGGTTYRRNPDTVNGLFNNIADAAIIHTPDLLGLGAINEQYMSFPVDTNYIKPDLTQAIGDRIKIGHWPSDPHVKGTQLILQVIDRLNQNPAIRKKFEYIGVTDQIPIMDWQSNLDRIRECDIYIEACQPTLDGKPYGEFGNTAMEAAALGKVVITHSMKHHVYEREYGKTELCIANNGPQLEVTLRNLIEGGRDNIYRKQESTLGWINRFHSFEATAQRLWDKVYRGFFL